MKILLVGVLDISWSTNCSMQRALESLGHTVSGFNYRTVTREHAAGAVQRRVGDKALSFLRSAYMPFAIDWYYRRSGRREMNEALLAKVREEKFDLIILSKTDTVNFRLIPFLNQYAPTWYFFMDPLSQALRINAPLYARFSTWASATFSDVAAHFVAAGADAVWLMQGVDPEVFKAAPIEKTHDVTFVGTRTQKRHKFIAALRDAGIGVQCVGEGWGHPPLYEAQLVKVYQESRIVLNFCQVGQGFSIRVFQVMGSGAFLLSEYCPDLKAIFQRGEHLDWFSNKEELIERVKYYLARPDESAKIAAAGNRIVHEKYTWKTVMNSLVSKVEREKVR